jgi:hypothetical protein
MRLDDVSQVKSKKDLVDYIQKLRSDFAENADDWSNSDIASFLEALQAWINDSDGYYKNQGVQPPKSPDWRFIALALSAAKSYE